MRKGAFTTGRNICSSSPVDTRGAQFVEFNTCRNCDGFGFSRLPGVHPVAVVGSRFGQPNCVLTTWSYCCDAICSCERRTIGSIPASMKGATATGPAIVMRYSKLPHALKSPPGNTIWSIGIGTLTAPRPGLLGSFNTGLPSGLVRVIAPALGRNATGDTDRMSNPRISFSPPMKKRWNGGETRPPKPVMNDPLTLYPIVLRCF